MSSTKQHLDKNLKTAMLAGDKDKVTLLRGLKSAILYKEVADGVRDVGLAEEDVVKLLTKEAKKRRESSDIYKQAGDDNRSAVELAEEKIINEYLPEQMTEEAIAGAVDEVIASLEAKSMQDMGKVIGGVKQKVGASADGSVIARIVKERLEQ